MKSSVFKKNIYCLIDISSEVNSSFMSLSSILKGNWFVLNKSGFSRGFILRLNNASVPSSKRIYL